MNLEDFIKLQMFKHVQYNTSFKKATSNSNEHYHPKTGKIIGWNEMCFLIETDAQKKANSIIKRMKKEFKISYPN